jgi:serine/threonine-protein kinase RsbT
LDIYNISIKREKDIYLSVSCAKMLLKKIGFSKAGEQKVLVSISELTRNVIDHAYGNGVITCKEIHNGIEFTVQDCGPGISNIRVILNQNRVASMTGLGMGLSGVKNLADDFSIETTERGTKVVVVKWKE